MQTRLNRIYTVIITVLVITIIILGKGCNDRGKSIDSLKQETLLLEGKYEKETKLWKDKYGNEHITSQRYQFEAEQLNILVKDQAKQLKVKSNQITQSTKIITNTVVETKLKVDTIHTSDSTSQLHFYYRDSWVDISGQLGKDSLNNTCDSISISLPDTLTKVDYWKKTGFLKLGAKKHYVDISNKNPYIHLVGVTQLELANKEPKVLIAPFVGFGYGSNNIVDRNPYPQLLLGVCVVPYKFSIKIH